MAIVAKSILEERKRAREAQRQAAEQVRSEAPEPASAQDRTPAQPEQTAPAAEPGRPKKDKKTKRAKKADRLKKQPTGDYETGYCRPPVEHRFDGSRAGPGRPPGAVSQDTLLRKHLTEAHTVARNGTQTKAQTRELVLMLRVKAALSGDRRAQDYVLAEASRLFAERRDATDRTPDEAVDMDEHDRAMLEALRDTLFPGTGQDNEPDEGDGDPKTKRNGGRS